MDEKARIYGERYPIDEDFLAALEIMPEPAPASRTGSALGFDRLVMLADAPGPGSEGLRGGC
jgi:lysyl-tRNA synthetase class 2